MGGMDAARSGRGLARRLAICVAGIIVLSDGVLLNTMTGLGTSVMNTFPYAVDAWAGPLRHVPVLFMRHFRTLVPFVRRVCTLRAA